MVDCDPGREGDAQESQCSPRFTALTPINKVCNGLSWESYILIRSAQDGGRSFGCYVQRTNSCRSRLFPVRSWMGGAARGDASRLTWMVVRRVRAWIGGVHSPVAFQNRERHAHARTGWRTGAGAGTRTSALLVRPLLQVSLPLACPFYQRLTGAPLLRCPVHMHPRCADGRCRIQNMAALR